MLPIEIRSDGSQIALAFNDEYQTMQIINPETGEIVQRFTGPEANSYPDIGELRWSPDGQPIAALTSPPEIRVWIAESGEPQHTISGIGILSDGTQVAIVGADTTPVTRREKPPFTNEAAIMVSPASAVLLNLDQIPMFMRTPN